MGKKSKKSKKIEIPGSWIRKLSIVKMSVVFTLIYEFSAVQTKIPERYYKYWQHDFFNMILKFICKGKETRIPKLILKRNNLGGFTLPKFKTYYKAIVQCWRTDRQINGWNKTQSPEIKIWPTECLQSCKSNLMENRVF